MANEVRVTCGLSVRKGPIDYQGRPTSYQDDMAGAKGPTPGAIAVALTGTVIDLSQLTTPGWCRFQNLEDPDTTANVTIHVGIREPVTGFFYPFTEFKPGLGTVVPMSSALLEEFTGTGTGTSAATNQLYAKAIGAAGVLLVECFEA